MAFATVRLVLALALPLAFAAPSSRHSSRQAGFSSQCTNIKLVDQWLVADCPGSSGTITSAVALDSWLSNKEGILTWAYQGGFDTTCSDCSLDGNTLSCTCRKTTNPALAASINLEEHIANYDGHLLSDINGTPSTPGNGSLPVPASFQYDLYVGVAGCASSTVTVSGKRPEQCWSLQVATGHWVEIAGAQFVSTNPGYSLTAYSSTDCSGEPAGTLEPIDRTTCKDISPTAKSFTLVPLFNADW